MCPWPLVKEGYPSFELGMKSGESADSNTIGDFPLSMENFQSANLMKSSFKGANVDGCSNTTSQKSHLNFGRLPARKPGGKQKLQ